MTATSDLVEGLLNNPLRPPVKSNDGRVLYGTVVELPAEETERLYRQVTCEWPIVDATVHGVSRDSFMRGTARTTSTSCTRRLPRKGCRRCF